MRTKWEENGENTVGMENVKSPLCNFMCAHYVLLICNNFSLISSTVSRAATKLTLIVNLSPDQCLNVINISNCVFFLLLFVRMKWEISKNIHLLYVELLCIIFVFERWTWAYFGSFFLFRWRKTRAWFSRWTNWDYDEKNEKSIYWEMEEIFFRRQLRWCRGDYFVRSCEWWRIMKRKTKTQEKKPRKTPKNTKIKNWWKFYSKF